MMFRKSFACFLAVLFLCSGCAPKADPKRPIEQIQQSVTTMPVAEIESYAIAYAAAIRAQKAEISKIQTRIQAMPVDKVFNDQGLTRRIAEIGRKAEALFERYRIYVKALEEKGGDLSKVKLEP